jgi:hypothetical protein
MPATNLWVFHFKPIFLARGFYLDLMNQAEECSADASMQNKVRTGISKQNVWNRAGLTKRGLPRIGSRVQLQQAAFFKVLAAIIVSVKILAFFAVGCFHIYRREGREQKGLEIGDWR